MHLASFFQNSINANKIELGEYNFDTKTVVTAIKLASKFFSKMQKHIDNNSVPKDVRTFARGFFVDATGGGFVHAPAVTNSLPPPNPLSRPNLIPTVSASLMVRSRKVARKSPEKSSLTRA